MRKFERTANYSNIVKLVEKRQGAGDNSQKGAGGSRGGTGGDRPLPPVLSPGLLGIELNRAKESNTRFQRQNLACIFYK